MEQVGCCHLNVAVDELHAIVPDSEDKILRTCLIGDLETRCVVRPSWPDTIRLLEASNVRGGVKLHDDNPLPAPLIRVERQRPKCVIGPCRGPWHLAHFGAWPICTNAQVKQHGALLSLV